MFRFEDKDPADVIDLYFDWADVFADLGGDTISSTAFSVTPAGLTIGATVTDAAGRGVFVLGGTVGQEYTLTCTVTTAGGRTIERSGLVLVRQR